MARKTDIPRVQNPPSGDGHHITSRYMTATELAERDARQESYDDMLARQQAYEDRFVRQPQQLGHPSSMGSVFAKSCNLPDGVNQPRQPSRVCPCRETDRVRKILPAGWPRKGCSGKHPSQKNQWQRITCCTGNASSGRSWYCWNRDGCCWRRHSDGWCCCWRLGRNGCIAVAVELGRQLPVHRRTAQITQGRPNTGSTACRATS